MNQCTTNCLSFGQAMMTNRLWVGLACVFLISGCRDQYREDLDYSYGVEQAWSVDELLSGEIVQFETVFWEADDSTSLRKMIVNDAIVSGRDVLEIGTGTGLISVLCLQNGAKSVVATDINPASVANATYNAAMLCPDQALDVRQVETSNPAAFAVFNETEKFDLVISNPPWEDGVVVKPADHAFYDPGFQLMDTLLDGLPNHLKPGGRCLLAYSNVEAIKRLQLESAKRSYGFKILDDRNLDSLDANFLPGMLMEIRPPSTFKQVQGGQFVPTIKPATTKPENDEAGSASENEDSDSTTDVER